MKRYAKLPENTRGRDFTVGDLHGCVDMFYRCLDALHFDPSIDRVFGVGDLPDRGPESLKTLELLNESWFKAVPGNHEAMMLTYLRLRQSHYHSPSDFINNGGDWIHRLSDGERERLDAIAQKVLDLPLTLIVDGEHPFNVVHGDLYPIGFSQAQIEANPEIDQRTADAIVWSRYLVNSVEKAKNITFEDQEIWVSSEALIPELNLTYVGHTILRAPIVHKSHAFIDQGAYVAQRQGWFNPSARMQIIEHRKFSEWLRENTKA